LLASYEGIAPTRVLQGKATYYGDSLAGNHTANGDIYDPKQFTAAHKTLPFGTVVRVLRVDTNRYVYVRINDRGPFGKKDRIIDLSRVAAERLGMIRAGVVPVKVEVLP
jgi:rare lipoprotein A